MRSRAGLVGDVLVAGCGAGVTRHDLAFCIGNLVVRGVAAPASRSKACHVARAVASRQKESYRRRGCFAGNSDHVSGSRGVTALGRRHERAKSEGWTSPDAWFLGEQERRARPSSRPSRVTRQRVLPRESKRRVRAVRMLSSSGDAYAATTLTPAIRSFRVSSFAPVSSLLPDPGRVHMHRRGRRPASR